MDIPDAADPVMRDERDDDIDELVALDELDLDLDEVDLDLQGVEIALERLDDGTYRTDELDGRPIPDDVLERNPLARRAP